MRRFLPLLFLLASTVSAFAQGGVLQSGVVTPGHVVQWLKNGVVADAGAPFSATGLPLTGGTLKIENNQSYIQLTPLAAAGTFSLHSAQLMSQWSTSASGGTAGNTSFNGEFYTSISGAPNEYLWSLQATVDYSGTGGTGQHVGLSGQAVRRTFSAGGSANNPELWAGLLQVNDLTATPSSSTNSEIGLEIDMANNGVDDSNKRSGIVIVTSRQDQTGAFAQSTNGIAFNSFNINDTFKDIINLAASYTVSALDVRTAHKVSGHAIWFSDGGDVAFDSAGNNTLLYSASAISAAGAVVLSQNLEVDGAHIFAPNAAVTLGGTLNIAANAGLTFNAQATGAAASVGTLTNAPNAGNPAFWLPVSINGINMWIPAWHP